MDKIQPQPKLREAESALQWLANHDNGVLRDDQLSDLIRMLINKINQLSHEVDYLRNRSNQHDALIG